MIHKNPRSEMDPYEFIMGNIDSVPHLEALVLLWKSSPKKWSCDELASRLYIPSEKVSALLHDLVRLQLVSESHGSQHQYSYFPRSEDQDKMMLLVEEAYRRDLVRISTMIHSKTSSAVREFARAFRFKKEQD